MSSLCVGDTSPFQAPEILCRSLPLGFSSCGLVRHCQLAFSCLGQRSQSPWGLLPLPEARTCGERKKMSLQAPLHCSLSLCLYLVPQSPEGERTQLHFPMLTHFKLHLSLSFSAHLGKLIRNPGCSLPWRWWEILALSTTPNPAKSPVLVFSSCFEPGWESCPTLPGRVSLV